MFNAAQHGNATLLINAYSNEEKRTYSYFYSMEDGVRKVEVHDTEPEVDRWTACYGRLTFDELPALLKEASLADPNF